MKKEGLNILKRIEFGCICELAEIMDDYIWDNSFEDEYPIVSAYANYEVAKALVEALIMLDNPIGAILDLEDYEMSHYDREYVVYLSEDGVTCEKTYHKDGYYNGGGDISFVHDDCSSKLLSHIDSHTICEFGVRSVGEEEYDCDDCDECCGCCECDKETKLATSTASYTVNGKSVTKEEFDKKYAEFENKYMDNIRDMLLSYCEFMDEVNEWSKLFRF